MPPDSRILPMGLAVGIAIVLLAAVLAFALPRLGTSGASSGEASASSAAADASVNGARVPSTKAAKVSFLAVGDNLPNENIGHFADLKKGKADDGAFDYTSLFQYVKPYVQEADVAYIDQETHVGGVELGVAGYPSFNTTDEMADAVVDAGFDLVASATNHSYDWGAFGALEHSLGVWEKQPVAFTGTAVTKEQYERIATVEREGIVFALLNYTYGVNGYTRSELPKYSVNFIDKARITSDVARARQVADVVLVAMHWGTENLTEADDDQKDLGQFLADLDVDVVLGSHPHVIGPMQWVNNSRGNGHRTLVAYSLGNFLADHEEPYDTNVLEGMLSCDFVRAEGSSAVSIENVKWTPLVCYSNAARDDFAVYALDDLPEKVAKAARALSDKDDPLGWVLAQSVKIVGAQWFTDEQVKAAEAYEKAAQAKQASKEATSKSAASASSSAAQASDEPDPANDEQAAEGSADQAEAVAQEAAWNAAETYEEPIAYEDEGASYDGEYGLEVYESYEATDEYGNPVYDDATTSEYAEYEGYAENAEYADGSATDEGYDQALEYDTYEDASYDQSAYDDSGEYAEYAEYE